MVQGNLADDGVQSFPVVPVGQKAAMVKVDVWDFQPLGFAPGVTEHGRGNISGVDHPAARRRL